MDFLRNTQESRQESYRQRARSARKWSRLTFVCLIGAGLTAVWQERAIAPDVHDRMQYVALYAADLLENSQSARGYLTAMTDFSGNGNKSQYDPITEALLKLRN